MSSGPSCASALLVAPHLSYRTGAYIQAAKALGISLTVASTAENALSGQGIKIDLNDVERSVRTLVDATSRTRFDGVLATDDATVEIASHVAGELGLPHNPASAARVSRRKDLSRERMAAAELNIPKFALFEIADAEASLVRLGWTEWPAVIKPLAWSGSRGVMRVDDEHEFVACAARLEGLMSADRPSNSFEAGHALIESFIPGVEVAFEGLMRQGSLVPLALFDKPDPLNGPFFEETYYVTPSREDQQTQTLILNTVERACAAFGLHHGPVHAEMRINQDGVWPLEIAARTIGGDCARLLKFGSGYGLEELVLANAVGLELETTTTGESGGVLMLPIERGGVLRRVEGVMAAQNVEGIEDVHIALNAGQELVPLPDGASYLGFIFARGSSPHEVERALRDAHTHLDVVVAPRIDVALA